MPGRAGISGDGETRGGSEGRNPRWTRLCGAAARRYFGPWRWELAGNGRVYELLGIRLWKRWLRSSGNPASRRREVMQLSSRRARLRESLRQHDGFTREYEVRHLLGGAAMQVGGWAFISMLEGGSLAVLSIANVLVNGYPILLQRYNRVRVHSALRRLGWQSASRAAGLRGRE